jgi:hypothetical protein
MNPESPQPGVSSGRKRKGPDTGGSLNNAEDSDGSWEDADSSDEDKLKIDEPKKKKVKNVVHYSFSDAHIGRYSKSFLFFH